MKYFNDLMAMDLEGKKVAVRIDVNSPVIDGVVQDNPRFLDCCETIRALTAKKAAVILLAHQGRAGDKDFLSLKQHAGLLSKKLRKKVKFADDFMGGKADKLLANLGKGKILLLENTRFLAEEFVKDGFENTLMAKAVAKHCNFFVNDAFAVCHRNQTSVVALPKLMQVFPGKGLEEEIKSIGKLTKEIEEPAVFVVGGAKTREALEVTKIGLERNCVILTGGVIGELFLLAKGHDLGEKTDWLLTNYASEMNVEKNSELKELKQLLEKYGGLIKTPVDFAVKDAEGFRVELSLQQISSHQGKASDIGSDTAKSYANAIKDAKTVLIKGPMGVMEDKAFQLGTLCVLKAMQNSSAFTLIGGGHTASSLEHLGFSPKKFGFVSTSGGAFMEMLAGKKLPGIEALG